MTNFRSGSRAWLLAGACSSALLALALPAPAFAQAAQDTQQPATPPKPEVEPEVVEPTVGDPGILPGETEGTDIVVTGIRAAIRGSISIKKAETSIVEAITAEDIGKLPDISIAESIARLPGLAAQRVGGRAQVISIRGLAPDFTTTLLNGRQQASSGDNRAVEFDQYPSELLASVVIYKTPDANIAGMGLAGTADLRTVRPLLFDKRTIALNVRGEVNTNPKLNDDVSKWGGRASASYIDHITPELGIALGVAYLNSPSSTKHTSIYNYEQFCPGNEDWCSYLHDQISPDSADLAFFPTGQEIFNISRTNKRLAGIGILEWEPSDRVHTILDLYYSRFKQRETKRGAQWFDNLWVDNTNYTDVQTEDRDGVLVATQGTATHVAVAQLRNDYNTRDDWLFSAGLNGEFKIIDELKFIGDLSYSSNKREESITETYAGYGCCARPNADGSIPDRVFDTISWDVRDNIDGNGFPQYTEGLNYADASQVSLGDHAPWTGWSHDGLTKKPHVREQVYAANGDFRYEPVGSSIETIDVGANFTRRDKKKRVDEFDLFLKNDRMQVLIDPDLLVDPTSLGYTGFGDVISYDVNDAIDAYYDVVAISPTDTNHYDKAWKVTEDVLTLMARTQFVFGNLHGNVGLQFVHQKQTSSGQRIDISNTPLTIAPVEQGASYWDVLPSLNTYYDLGGGHRIRFALSKLLARPRMDEMRANLTPSFTNPCLEGAPCIPGPGHEIHPWSASGGNPELEPWRAKAVDLSYEWYIGPASYIAIAAFYKKLDSYIYTQVLPYDFSGLPLPTAAAGIPPGVIIDPIGTITQPANGNGGNIRGIELSGALELGRVTNFLNGFGVLGSLSKTKTNLNPVALNPDGTEPPPVRIPGLSGTVANITGFYEKYGFQARISYRYRSAFKGEVVQLFATRGNTEILADKQVDAQIGYTFQKGSRFENLGFQLQIYNLTNSPYRTRIGLDEGGPVAGTTFIEQYEKYGRQILFGVNYVF